MSEMIDAWLAAACADAERRGLPELKPLLESLARSTAALRAADLTARLFGLLVLRGVSFTPALFRNVRTRGVISAPWPYQPHERLCRQAVLS
mgnify:CR=1 FL=1